jgi:DNA-binding SARP family transcriptional activator
MATELDRRHGDAEGGPFPAEGKAGARTGSRERSPGTVRLELLGGFHLGVDGRSIHVPLAERRLLASIALHDRPRARSALVGQLWPDTTTDRALGRLRTALWRVRRSGWPLIEVVAGDLALNSSVVVDVGELIALSRRVLDAPNPAVEARLGQIGAAGELLPDWDDQWLIADRERIHQLRLHSLEMLTERHAHEGRYGLAIDEALAVIADDPLRETARRALIRVYAAEGNVHDALSQYEEYRNVMRDDLGLDPSPQMEALIEDLRIGSPAADDDEYRSTSLPRPS